MIRKMFQYWSRPFNFPRRSSVSSRSFKSNKSHWKPMKINEHQWKLKEINEIRWNSMKISENDWFLMSFGAKPPMNDSPGLPLCSPHEWICIGFHQKSRVIASYSPRESTPDDAAPRKSSGDVSEVTGRLVAPVGSWWRCRRSNSAKYCVLQLVPEDPSAHYCKYTLLIGLVFRDSSIPYDCGVWNHSRETNAIFHNGYESYITPVPFLGIPPREYSSLPRMISIHPIEGRRRLTPRPTGRRRL